MRRGWIALALAAAVVLTGCGGDGDDEAATSPTSSPSASSASPSASPSPSVSLEGAGFGPFTSDAAGTRVSFLTDVRVAAQAGFDRVALQFDGAVPGYLIEYSDGPFLNTAGQEVDIEGEAFIRLIMEPASTVDLSIDPFVETYEGPDRVTSDTVNVTESVLVDDFEANMVWVIGVNKKAEFAVSTLEDPNRLVVDVLQ
jgi:hypothetical protein